MSKPNLEEIKAQQDLLRRRLDEEEQALTNLAKRLWAQQESEKARLSRELHDGVGQLIEIAVTNAKRVNSSIKIGVCGELGGDAKSIRRFNQLDIDYVSCSPFRVPGAILATAQSQAEESER